MRKINSIDEIHSVKVHWSESNIINDALGCDDNGDINKIVMPSTLDFMLGQAAKKIKAGYDKIELTVLLHNGKLFSNGGKFYLNRKHKGLLDLLNEG